MRGASSSKSRFQATCFKHTYFIDALSLWFQGSLRIWTTDNGTVIWEPPPLSVSLFKLATYDHLTVPHLDRINAAFSGFNTQTTLRHSNTFTLTCITSVQPSVLTGKSAHFLRLRLNISLPSYLRVVTFPPAATEELTRSLSCFFWKEIVKEKKNWRFVRSKNERPCN